MGMLLTTSAVHWHSIKNVLLACQAQETYPEERFLAAGRFFIDRCIVGVRAYVGKIGI
ncbi:hypothetical protein ALP39_200471 [Pseudomonas marginalis pv. marginalis]|nr:hypothetical protein ALP39_200471 [Pseudomonas marginalis pv. marginalis]